MELQQPYYAVIFTNTRTDGDFGYAEMAEQMERLAKQQKGYLGFESARSNLGIAVSYWESLEAIADWKANLEHLYAQKKGKSDWYSWYKVRICRVEREYEFKST
ncbi:antibiotic biosynthesis monooxygenase [Flavobacteriaceae bacterium GF1]